MKYYFYVARWNDPNSDDPFILHVTSDVMRVHVKVNPDVVHDKIRAKVAKEHSVPHNKVFVETLTRL